jgi:hypothetical protein
MKKPVNGVVFKARARLLPLGEMTGNPRWLLEVFDLQDLLQDPPVISKHAVWLSLRGASWHWWCCCGVQSEEKTDLVGVLCTARMHFDAFPSSPFPTPVEHPIAAWSRIEGPAGDDLAVADLAERILRPAFLKEAVIRRYP